MPLFIQLPYLNLDRVENGVKFLILGENQLCQIMRGCVIMVVMR